MRRHILFLIPILLLSGCQKEPGLSTQSANARNAYLRGIDLWQQFYYADAKSAFEEAIQHDSSFAMAWGRLAMVEMASHDDPQAKGDMQHALAHSTTATRREQLYLSMWNHRLNFDLTESAQAADSLIQLYPDDPEPYVFRGMLYELGKNLEAAIQMYQEAIAVDSTFVPAVMSLGYAYSSANEQEKAISQMARYIRLAPNAADPRASYADLLFRVGRYDDALDQYRKSLQLKEDYWYAFNRIGEVYALLGRLDEAEEQFNRGFALMPPNPQLEASHVAVDAGLEIRRGRYKEAVEMYRKALAVDSTNLSAAYGFVYALTELKQYEQAHATVFVIHEELERRNLTKSSVMLGYHLVRARLLAEEDSLQEASLECGRALEYSSPLTRAEVFRQQAEIFLKERAFENAFEALEGALRVNPNNPHTLLILAKIYHAKNDRRMTMEIGDRLLKLWSQADPDFQELLELKRILPSRT